LAVNCIIDRIDYPKCRISADFRPGPSLFVLTAPALAVLVRNRLFAWVYFPFCIGGLVAMNKQELIATVADTSGLTKGDASKAVEAVFDAVSAALKKGDEVRLVGFGTFSVSKRKASTGRNPRTGEPMTIKASSQPKFKAGKGLKDSVN
jgi:DNA-binding protein HU-beta